MADFDLRPLLQSLLDMYRPQALRHGLSLVLEVAPEVSYRCTADPGRVHQIMANLLSNAVRYSRPGCVALRACIVETGQARFVRLSVCDAGPPIPKERHNALFRPFSRLVAAEEDDLPGSGLGLSICLALAARMGGGMGYSQTILFGNEFWLILPCQPAEPALFPPAPERRVDRLQPAGGEHGMSVEPRHSRILLVEDVDANRNVTAALLRRRGWHVEATASALDALHVLSERDFDVVLTDVAMPGLSGIDLARAIHGGLGRSSAIKIIGLSGFITEEDRLRGAAVGMSLILEKPLHWPALEAVINGEPTIAAAPAVDAACPVVSSGRIDELRTFLSPEALRQVIGDSLAELVVRLTALHVAANPIELAGIEAAAHAMAGLAGNCGMAAVEERLRALIVTARGGDIGAVEIAVRDVESELTRASVAIPALLPALD